MNHRERVLAAINHKEPDRIPLDFGSTPVSGIHMEEYWPLVRYLGMEKEVNPDPPVLDLMQGLVELDEKVLQRFDIDIRGIWQGPTDQQYDIFTPGGTWTDEFGVTRHKPAGSHYYDMIRSPFEGDNLTKQDIDNFAWSDPADPGRTRGMRKRAKYLKEETDYAVILNYQPVVIHQSQYMRGFTGWFEDLLTDPERLSYLFDKILDWYLRLGQCLLDEVGDLIDIVSCPDDISGQSGPLYSPTIYRNLIKPLQDKLYHFVRQNTDAALFYHSCGDMTPFMDDLVDLGIDILNPVQTSAAHMDPQFLKKNWGDKICFHGAIDTQHVLPFGTVGDVEECVEKIIKNLGAEGGFILNSVHNLQPGIPPENIVAMFDHAREFGRYPIQK